MGQPDIISFAGGIPDARLFPEEEFRITSCSQLALDYLGKLFLSPGDTALVGWPTYLGALGALGAFNAYEPVYDQLVIGGNQGAEDYRARAEAASGRVKFAHLSADFANPSGETVDRKGREALLDLARDLDVAVIEDAAYQALHYDGDPVPPILALDIARTGISRRRARFTAACSPRRWRRGCASAGSAAPRR